MVCAVEKAQEYISQEESDVHHTTKGGFGSRTKTAAIGLVGLAALVTLLGLCGYTRPAAWFAWSSSKAAPLTVRALLESDELAGLATDNLMAMSGNALASAGHDNVRDRVARELQNVSDAIRSQYPEAHRQLDRLRLSRARKEASLRVVRKFGDLRMVGLARDIVEATRQAQQESDDQDALHRRLSEVLAARVRAVQQLTEEMFPDHFDRLDAVAALPQLRGRRPSAGGRVSQQWRRLSDSHDSIEQDVQAHVHTLLKSLEAEFAYMPEAPARMLSSSSGGHTSFSACVVHVAPNPTKVCKCIVDNLSEVLSMTKGSMPGETR
mmetsp:Transcript_48679/g.122843  ORF Transcript_48679/g.122843 Transcript_48679/m.122843 type:complete len:323 (-) Transcript_48679:23-991(-)